MVTGVKRAEGNMVPPEIRELADKATAFYDRRLRPRLEKAHRGEFVAIEPESGDYFLARGFDEAIEAARAANPDHLA